MNDSIIIGSVIVLVFGALCYYLYSRLLYSGKRVIVMENILLDLKTASESWFATSEERQEDHPHREDNQQQDHQHQDHQHQEHQPQPNEPLHEQSQYTPDYSLNDLAVSSEPVVSESLPEVVEHVLQQVASEQKVSVNYESMNIKELQAEARSKNISGVSSMRRKELIELLRKSDQSVTETVSNFPALNSFVDNAAPVVANA